MRFAVDTGGTFTDLVVEDAAGRISLYKTPTTPDDPVVGVLDALALAAEDRGLGLEALLRDGRMFIHGTTRAINAILTATTARTALLATKGHPDMLLLREAGRTEPFNWTRPFPRPYVPRSLTFQVPERIGSQGQVLVPLDEHAVVDILGRLRELEVEAVAVCLLWSFMNSAHERRVGELIETHFPGVPYTLSHVLNPVIREFRRACSTALDAALKPLMAEYLKTLEERLRGAGFGGRVLMVASNGGVLDASHMAEAPIHSINSGPAMAPVAGRYYAETEASADTAVVADTGGTSYDVSLVRHGVIPMTRETWLGPPYMSEITGFPAVDVKSIGAGGGSIAWLDASNLLHVGPSSAGSVPGPVCYGRGGTSPTVTDACLVLGYLDPAYFLGGKMPLDVEAACRAMSGQIAEPLGLAVKEASAAVLTIATEHMVQAIHEITVDQGVDPRGAALVGGGGAAGLNIVAIARRLGCPTIVIPPVGAVLSAAGALMSELTAEFAAALFTSSGDFNRDAANTVLEALEARCEDFRRGAGTSPNETAIEFVAEARYAHQVWQLDVPLTGRRFGSESDVEELVARFRRLHEELYAVSDQDSTMELTNLRARVTCRIRERFRGHLDNEPVLTGGAREDVRPVYFAGVGMVDARVARLESLASNEIVEGPAILESSFTTVVIDPGAVARVSASGSLVLTPSPTGKRATQAVAEATA